MSQVLVFSASIVLILSVVSFPLINHHATDWWSLRLWSYSSVADLVVKNAVIFTSDTSVPFADSMAIRNGRILGVGSYSSIKDLVGLGTKELNLEGKVVVPGFIDSHVHLIFGGLQMMRVNLHGLSSKDAFVSKVQEAVRNKEQGSWVLGGGWNNDLWGGDLPTASWIDELTPDNPVWLSRMDGHMGLANSAALKMAGITSKTDDPNGGTIVRKPDGDPSGLLIDAAMKLVLSWIPVVSVNERREALEKASNYALAKGVTTVVDFGRYFPGASTDLSWEDFSDVYQWSDSSGKMKIRACLYFPMETWSRLSDLKHKTSHKSSQWIWLGGVKAFADGSLGSNSALFYESYANEPHNYGLQVTKLETLHNMTMASDRVGLQVAIHAIGDKANDQILDMYQSVATTNKLRDRRFRIEHAQHLVPGATTRFGEENIIASVQPDHLLDDADSAVKKLGKERANKGSYLFNSLLTSKARLAFGSDWPVANINPLGSIETAMKRIPPGWENAWASSERISLIDALNAYTISAAHACFLDNDLGSLSSGKLADFVILSTNSWDDFAKGESANVAATYVGGIRAFPR